MAIPAFYGGEFEFEKKFNPGFCQFFIEQTFKDFRIDMLPDRVNFVSSHPMTHILEQFEWQAGTDPMFPIGEMNDCRHQSAGGHAAAAAGLFQQNRPGSEPGGSECGGDSGGSTAADNDVAPGESGNCICAFHISFPRLFFILYLISIEKDCMLRR